MNQTLKQFAQDNYEDSDHDTLVQWMIEIGDAIDDDEDVSEENLSAWNTKPDCWDRTGFESGVVIADDPRGAAVWSNADHDHTNKQNRHRQDQIDGSKEDGEMIEKYGPRSGFNRGVSF